MKYIYSFLLTLGLIFSIFGQQISVSKIDEFTKKELIQVNASKDKKWRNSDNIAEGFYNHVFLSLRKTDTLQTVQLDIQRGSLICINNQDGKVIALFDDTSTIELPQVSRIDCAQRIVVTYYLPKHYIEKLANNKLKKLRIHTTEGYFDLTIKEDKKTIVQETFKLFKTT